MVGLFGVYISQSTFELEYMYNTVKKLKWSVVIVLQTESQGLDYLSYPISRLGTAVQSSQT